MLGWEFPPYISGGLGTACYGLTKALDQMGVQITFVLPTAVQTQFASHVKLVSPAIRAEAESQTPGRVKHLKNVRFRSINTPLQPYQTASNYQKRIEDSLAQLCMTRSNKTSEFVGKLDYSGDMYTEVQRYAELAVRLALNEEFDVIHAHDWMTYHGGGGGCQSDGQAISDSCSLD